MTLKRSKVLWSHKCEYCGRIYSHYCPWNRHAYICDDCQARLKALKLPLASAVAEPFLALPMTHDSSRRGTNIEEPHPIPVESLGRGHIQAGRVAHNRGVLRRWKKKP